MICPKCQRELKDGCCLKCGYMDNGNSIDLIKKEENKFEDMQLFNNDFDKMYRNENSIFPLIFGSYYLSYRGYLILGTLLGILDPFLCILIGNKLRSPYFQFTGHYSMIFYIILTRILYGTTFNALCITLDKIKIKWLKKIYKDKYKERLIKHKSRLFYVFLNFLIYAIIITIIIVIRRIQNGTINEILF